MKSLPNGRRLVLALSILLALAVVIGGGISSYRKIGSFQPLGFEAQREAGNWRVATAEGETGLLAGDEILLVNGDSFAQTTDLEAALRQQVESRLLLLRNEELVDLTYSLPPLDIDLAYLVLALIGCVYLLVGLYTLLRDQRAPAIVFFLWAVTSAIVYLFSPVGPFDPIDKLLYIGEELARLLLAPLTLHLFMIFPRPIAQTGSRGRWTSAWAVSFFYLPAAFMILLQGDLLFTSGRWFFGGNTAAALGVLDRLELFHLVLFGLAAAAVMGWRLLNTTKREARRQTTWIALGLFGGYLPFALLYVLPRSLGASWPDSLAPVTVLFLALVPITFAYAILRYRLWDIGVLVRDTASLALTILLGVGGFALANLVVNRLVPDDMALGRNLLVFVSGLTIAGLMVPTRRAFGQSLERLQYRGRFGQRRALVEIGKDLLNERDLDKLCKRLCEEIKTALDIRLCNVLLRHGDVLVSWRSYATGGLEEPVPVDSFPPNLWTSAVHGLPAVGLPDQDSPELELFGAGYRYAFPLAVRDRGLAVFVCGYKTGAVPLNSDDIDLVRGVLNQTALAIENAQLLHRVQSQLDEMGRLQRFNEEVVAASPAGIAVLDESNRILSANRAFAKLTEKELDMVRGKSLFEILPIASLPKPGEGIREVSYRSAEGEDRYLQASTGALADPQRAGNTVLVVQDVSQRVALETALKESDRLASLGVLAAGVAHEVNTPITGISSYAQMLLEETPEGDPRRPLLKKVEKQTFRAARIVNNLLNLARRRGGERQSTDLIPLISECLDLLRERMANKGIELTWSPPGQPIVGWVCEGELQQVITNLVMNAIDAMGTEGGKLVVDTETKDNWIWIGVEDTGPGIPTDQLDQIFEPFYSTRLAQGGTGLGLSISHDLIKQHGGDIRVISHPGEGCRFVVELPLGESAP